MWLHTLWRACFAFARGSPCGAVAPHLATAVLPISPLLARAALRSMFVFPRYQFLTARHDRDTCALDPCWTLPGQGWFTARSSHTRGTLLLAHLLRSTQPRWLTTNECLLVLLLLMLLFDISVSCSCDFRCETLMSSVDGTNLGQA